VSGKTKSGLALLTVAFVLLNAAGEEEF